MNEMRFTSKYVLRAFFLDADGPQAQDRGMNQGIAYTFETKSHRPLITSISELFTLFNASKSSPREMAPLIYN